MAFTSNGYQGATAEILERIKTSLDLAPTVLGQELLVSWPGVEMRVSPPGDAYWARVSLQGVRTENAAFRGDGSRRLRNYGLVFVQVFCPRADDEGIISAAKGRALCDLILKNTFHARPPSRNVLFRNARVVELSPEDKFYCFKLVADTEYDEII